MRIPVQELVEMYKDNIYAAAFNICKSAADAEDVVQDTFLQYYMTKKEFDDEKHIRYWLLRVAINKAKIFSPHSDGKMKCRLKIMSRRLRSKRLKAENYLKKL